MEYDRIFMLGLASLLSDVIKEAEHIQFTSCSYSAGNDYMIYIPSYPWELAESERRLTEDKIVEVLSRYISLLTDKVPDINYQSVENGS